MSVASEFAPDVVIPERARRSVGGRRAARHLTLVPAGPAEPDAGLALPRAGRLPAGAGDRAGTASGSLRLTRRGMVVAVVATLLLCASLMVVAGLSATGGAAGARVGGASHGGTVTVQPGDTLWSIAEQAAPGKDPRLVVDALRRVNHLTSPALVPGQTLKLG